MPAITPVTCLPSLDVLDYFPTRGGRNSQIHVFARVDQLPFDVRLRLVLGSTALPTYVERRPESNHLYRLAARAPDFLMIRSPSPVHVPLHLQAMKSNACEVLETMPVGTFSYIDQDVHVVCEGNVDTSSVYPVTLQDDRDPAEYDGGSPEKGTFVPSEVHFVPMASKGGRRSCGSSFLKGESHPAELEWVISATNTHPDAFAVAWTKEELRAGRRLIRFDRGQSGHKLLVACTGIQQEDYVGESDIVISCIVRPQTHKCYFTSVDIIYLLERLIGVPFMVEEKNRIRRNLEGFKPLTVSKSRGEQGAFFQRIMDFPPPKPRNIEKDVKVFSWDVLGPALSKIISKYSLYVGKGGTQERKIQRSPSIHAPVKCKTAIDDDQELMRYSISPMPSPSASISSLTRDYFDVTAPKSESALSLQSQQEPRSKQSPDYSMPPTPLDYGDQLGIELQQDVNSSILSSFTDDSNMIVNWHALHETDSFQKKGNQGPVTQPPSRTMYSGSESSTSSSPTLVATYFPGWSQPASDFFSDVPGLLSDTLESPMTLCFTSDHGYSPPHVPEYFALNGEMMAEELSVRADVCMYAPGSYSGRSMSPVC